jgi:hypothetical protein
MKPPGDEADRQGYQQRQVYKNLRDPGDGCRLSASFEPIWLAGSDRQRQPLNEPARDPACLR